MKYKNVLDVTIYAFKTYVIRIIDYSWEGSLKQVVVEAVVAVVQF